MSATEATRMGRAAYGIPRERVWLDTAHQGPLPLSAARAARQAVEWKLDPSHLDSDTFFATTDRLREALAGLLGRPAGEVAIGDSASHGLHLLASGLALEEGEEVLLVRDDFPATLTPWLPLRERGIQIRFLARREGLTAERIAAALRPETRVFCVTWIDSFSGHILDVEAVGRACRAADVVFVLNATQGLGVRPLPLDELPVDAVTCAGYKWLCGPYGTGFCWISPGVDAELRSHRRYWLPVAGRTGLAELGAVAEAPPVSDASRHDVFGTASFFNVLPFIEALSHVRTVGIGRAAEHNRALVAGLREVVEETGHPYVLHPDAPFLVFHADGGGDERALAREMRAAGVLVGIRDGRLRVSPHLHNDLDDVERFRHVLRSSRHGGATLPVGDPGAADGRRVLAESSPGPDPAFIAGPTSPSLDTVAEGMRRVAATLEAQRPLDLGEGEEAHSGPPSTVLVPDEGLLPDELLDELVALARDSTRVAHPGWMGHMDPPPTWASVLAAGAAALLNNNLLSREMSPSFTGLEKEVLAGLARELGLGPGAAGTFTAGGSVANLLALAVARNIRLRRLREAGGHRYDALSRMTVVTSADAHASVRRAAGILGLDPDEGVLEVAAAGSGTLDPAATRRAVEAAEGRGRLCFALVATAGTTVLGAIDPLAALGGLARERGMWFHVDAAFAGTLALTRARRGLVEGLGKADSVTFNPQKWLYVAKVCAVVLFRDRDLWLRGSTGPLPYTLPGEDSHAAGLRIEGTRHADVLKLRLALLQLGRTGVERLVERSFSLAELVEGEVRRRPYLELAAPRQTSIVVFRCAAHPGTGTDATSRLHRWLLERANVFLSLPLHRGDRWLRTVLINPATDAETVKRVFSEADAFARAEGLA